MHRLLLWVQGVLVPALGPVGVFLIAFLDSSFLSLPEINDLLVVSTAAAQPDEAWLVILMATFGSFCGCVVLWELGRRGGEPFLERRFGVTAVARARATFERYDLLALAVPAIVPPPMPFKIFVISAGVFGFSLRRFALTVLFARGLRYLFWGGMGAFYGDEAVRLLKTVDDWFAAEAGIIAAAIAVTLLVAVGLFLRHRRRMAAGAGDAR